MTTSAVAAPPLRRSVGWLPRPGVQLMRQGGTALADQVVVSGTTFATCMLVGRACGPEQFGLFMLAFSFALILSGLMISLITAPYIVRRPHLEARLLPRYDGDTLLYLLALCGLAAFGLLVATGAAAAAGFGPPGTRSLTLMLAGVIGVQLLKEYTRQMCFARMRMASALAIDGIVGVLQLGGLLWLATAGRLTPSTAFGAIGLACGLASLGWWFQNRRTFQLRPRRAVREFPKHWRLARFAFASGTLHAVTVNLYPWIVAWAGGAGAAGVWAACFAVAALIAPPVTGAHNYLAPRLADAYARGGRPVLRQLAMRSSGAFWAMALPYAGFLSLFGGLAVAFCYGPQYAGHSQLVAIVGAALVAGAAGFSFGRALFSLDRADLDLAANVLGLAILLIAGTALAWHWGPLGAAYGMLITNTVTSLIKAAMFLRQVRGVTPQTVA